MGSSSQSSSSSNNLGAANAQQRYNQLYGPLSPVNPLTEQLAQQQQSIFNNYTNAVGQAQADYSGIMGGYNSLANKISSTPPTTFNWNAVSSPTPAQLTEGYGDLRSAAAGYQNFADTGGYSDQDIADLRARGISPVRATYANAQANIDRAKSLGGGYAPNYIAATAKMARDQSQGAADATQQVNAQLAEDIRSGKLAGLGGLASVGGTIGGLSLQDAQRILSANLANSQGGLQAAGMTYGAAQDQIKNLLGIGQAQTSLYGTTPGQASMFGNQALQAMSQRLTQMGMSQDDASRLLSIMSGQQQQSGQSGPAWWTYALSAAPYIAMAFSDRNMKEDIKPIDEKKVLKGIKKLNLATWRYKGDPKQTTHMGPMAQDVKKHLGIGDGKTLHIADIMGVMLATSKNKAAANGTL